MALLEGTVIHTSAGRQRITLDTTNGAFAYDPLFERWFEPGNVVPGPDGRPLDREADPERWLRALRYQYRRHPMTIEVLA